MKKVFLTSFLLSLFLPSSLYCQTLSGDIELYISAYIDQLPGSNENDYSIPEASDLKTWQELLTHLLNDELSDARQKADLINYQVVEFEDNSISPHAYYYVVEEKINRQHYWGTYIINRNPLRSQLVIQSPHPVYDSNTGRQGIFCFKRLGALAFFISGTHRCNHGSYSACSGTTSVCSSSYTAYRVSDNAHNLVSIFQKTTEVLYNELGNTVFVQLHGFAMKTSDPYLIISNGSRITPVMDYIAVLKNELAKIDISLTFKIAHIDLSWSRLIAFTNVQGRFINNSISPCNVNASTCTGRFIHVEQEKSKLRKDFTGWLKMYEALSKTFPEDPTSVRNLLTKREKSVFIYPNPSEGLLTIKASGPFSFSIFNAIGKCIYQGESAVGISEIDLSMQLPGIYLVKIKCAENINIKRIILK